MQKKVIVYSKDNCMQCKFTKQWLEDWNIPYTEVRADLDEAAMHYVKSELGFRGLPVVEIEGKVPFQGFRPDRLEDLLYE